MAAVAPMLVPRPVHADVVVDLLVPPFPTSLDLATRFNLFASGTRLVTFVGFRVYAVGLYLAEADEPVLEKTVRAFVNKNVFDGTVQDATADPQLALALVQDVLDAGVRFAVRIVPVRNTDFGHLRDGFVRLIMAHPAAKQDEAVPAAIEALRGAMARKGLVPKGGTLLLEQQTGGRVAISYDGKEHVEMGTVPNEVGRYLMMQYLNARKPLLAGVRDEAYARIVEVGA